ncbi:hypothetical protein V8C37DRAFT_415003 [Trichoderma ceciliae]
MAQRLPAYPFPYSQAAQLDSRIKISRPVIDPALVPMIDSCLLPEEVDLNFMRGLTANGDGETYVYNSDTIIKSAPHLKHTEHLVSGPNGNTVTLSVFAPKGSTPTTLPALYHVHGGGMIAGDRFAGVAELLDMLKGIECVVVSVEYRLAPETRAPGLAEDCYAGLVWASENSTDIGIDPAKIVVWGASGGAALAAAVCLMARDRKSPAIPIKGQMLLSPMLDDRCDSISDQQFEYGSPWCGVSNRMAWHHIIGEDRGTDKVSHYQSPSRAQDLANLPSTYIDAAECEVFRDPAVFINETQYPMAPSDTQGGINEKQDAVIRVIQRDTNSLQDEEAAVHEDAQAGVQGVEAIAIVWSKTALVVAYILIWIVYFIVLMQQGAEAALNPFVTSAFQQHSLTPTVGILAGIIGGVCNLTVAKILDIFGRPQGYAMSLLIATVGLIMMAATTNVEMYAAAQVFWTVGNTALLYTVNILVADTTKLHNRGLMTALTSSPNIITTWLGGPISNAFLNGPGWRWCFGAFSVIVPVACLPLFGLLMFNYFKAKKQGVISSARKETRAPWASFLHYCREFDAIGLLLLTTGLALFLLPFNLYAMQPLGWRSPFIICLLVFGFVLAVVFAIWERYFAPVTFIPYSLLLDRNMMGACVLGMVLFISFFCWNSFFSSFLQVVNNLNVTEASYVVQIYGLGSSLFAIAAGVAIRYTGRFKAITLYGAIPVYALFMGLMIYFRQPNTHIGYIIMCQIFISMAGGVVIITSQMAAMTAASHQYIAVVMAILSMFSSIGGAIGLTAAGAIWQSIFPTKLAEYLPPDAQPDLLSIYSMLEVQLSYPVGSPTRIAIQRAYGDAQSRMLIAGTAIWVIGFAGVAMWRNDNIKNMKQVRGQVI